MTRHWISALVLIATLFAISGCDNFRSDEPARNGHEVKAVQDFAFRGVYPGMTTEEAIAALGQAGYAEDEIRRQSVQDCALTEHREQMPCVDRILIRPRVGQRPNDVIGLSPHEVRQEHFFLDFYPDCTGPSPLHRISRIVFNIPIGSRAATRTEGRAQNFLDWVISEYGVVDQEGRNVFEPESWAKSMYYFYVEEGELQMLEAPILAATVTANDGATSSSSEQMGNEFFASLNFYERVEIVEEREATCDTAERG